MEQKINLKYKQLELRIKTIQKNLDFKQSPSGITAIQSDKLRAIIVLSHAEIESYIEDLALIKIDEAEAKWKNTKIADYSLASLFINHERIETSDTSFTKSFKIIKEYRKVIEDNHGIKEHNIKNLFGKIGYKIDDFDSVFIANLEAFGGERGTIAHTTATRVTQQMDKSTVLNKINDIVRDLKDFQKVLFDDYEWSGDNTQE